MPAPDRQESPSGTDSKASTLPPGMVLGPDGKPCRTCTDWKSWSKIGKAKAKKDSKETASSPSTSASGAAGAASAVAGSTLGASAASTFNYENECPPDKE